MPEVERKKKKDRSISGDDLDETRKEKNNKKKRKKDASREANQGDQEVVAENEAAVDQPVKKKRKKSKRPSATATDELNTTAAANTSDTVVINVKKCLYYPGIQIVVHRPKPFSKIAASSATSIPASTSTTGTRSSFCLFSAVNGHVVHGCGRINAAQPTASPTTGRPICIVLFIFHATSPTSTTRC